jgi:acetyl esterase
MFQAIKVWVFRKYYRIISAWNWRGHSSDIHWGGLGDFGPSNGRLVIAGGSAGANLIASTCMTLQESTRALVSVGRSPQ